MARFPCAVVAALIVSTQPMLLLGGGSDAPGESRHASNLLPEPKFNFPKWNGGTSSAVSPTGNVDEDDEDDPIFDNSFVTNVTAQLGKSAHLQCTVLNIKQSNPVSWIRRRDWHILSVGDAVFTQDARFQLHRDVGGGSKWTLMIKFLEEKDEGTYVCQVSTKTGVKLHYFNLHVLVPAAFILGSDEYHTQAGNAISLVCIIENSLDPPQYVFWYHNGKLINYDRVSRISIKTDPGPKTHSRLIINDVMMGDSGNYTCSAPNTLSSSIDVFVSPGTGDKTLSLSDHSGAVAVALSNLPFVLFVVVFYFSSSPSFIFVEDSFALFA